MDIYEKVWGPVKRSKAAYKIVVGGRRTRKTQFLCEWCAEISKVMPPLSRISCVSPTIRMAKQAILPRMLQVFGDRVKKTWAGDPMFEIEDGKVIVLRWVPSPVMAMDEAGYLAQSSNLMRLLQEARAAMVSGSPFGRNWFWRLWQYGGRGKFKRAGWKSWRIKSAGLIPAAELKVIKKSMSKELFRQEYESQFVGPIAKELREENK